MKHHLLKKLEQAILLVLVFLLAFEPALVAARPEHVNAQADLLSYGFTQAQIDEVAVEVAQRGLVNGNLNTRLAQFRATQDELADTRSGMLILAVQLLGYQIAVRQSNGLQPRPATNAELQALAEDELRLLIHAAHLNAMWGNDPSAEIGEGDWWFIEHFADRAGDRLQTLIVETQNRGLVAELFLIRQMKMLAVSARNGDAEYAKSELDGLTALLAHRLDATAYYQQHNSPAFPALTLARLVTAPSLREKVQWPVSSSAIKTARMASQERMDSAGFQNLAVIIGAFEESNEINNTGGILIIAGLEFFDQLTLDFVQASLKILAAVTPRNVLLWMEAILTGDTDNPALLAANVIISLLPVIGAIPDIVTLAIDASNWIKALSILGIIGSVGDLVALTGIGIPAAVTSFVGDAVATLGKILFRKAATAFRVVLNGLKLAEAFDVALDLAKTVIRVAGAALQNSSTSHAVFELVSNIFTGTRSLWDDFIAFVTRAKAGLLLKLGFDEGSALVGRILRGGTSLGDEALLAVDNVGDKIAKLGVTLTDEGMDGVGVLAKNVDPEDVTKFSDELLAICGAAGSAPGNFKLARPFFRANSDCVNRVTSIIGDLDGAAEAGLNKLCKSIGGDKMAALAKKYSENGLEDAFKKSLALSVSDPKFVGWTSQASEKTLDKLVSVVAKENGEVFYKRLLSRLCQTDCTEVIFDEQFRRILNRVDSDKALYDLMFDSNLEKDAYNGIATLLRNIENPKGIYKYMYGWEFQLERVKSYGLNLKSVEEAIVLDNGKQAAYDFTLKSFNGLGETIGETKYWQKPSLQKSAGSIVSQLSARSTANKPILLELGFTRQNPISGSEDEVVKDLIKRIEDEVTSMTVEKLGLDSTGTVVQILLRPKP